MPIRTSSSSNRRATTQNDLRSDRSDFASDNFLPRNLRPNLIVVANALENGDMADDATFGAPFVTLAAQGTGLMTVRADGGFIPGEGSSNAAPTLPISRPSAPSWRPPHAVRPQSTADRREHADTPAWEGRVAGSGIVDHDHCLYLAALSNLIHSGRSLDEAKQQLALTPERAAELMAQLRRAETIMTQSPHTNATRPRNIVAISAESAIEPTVAGSLRLIARHCPRTLGAAQVETNPRPGHC